MKRMIRIWWGGAGRQPGKFCSIGSTRQEGGVREFSNQGKRMSSGGKARGGSKACWVPGSRVGVKGPPLGAEASDPGYAACLPVVRPGTSASDSSALQCQ